MESAPRTPRAQRRDPLPALTWVLTRITRQGSIAGGRRMAWFGQGRTGLRYGAGPGGRMRGAPVRLPAGSADILHRRVRFSRLPGEQSHMEQVRYRVRGGSALRGTAFVQGAKNAALPMIAAALLAARGRTVLRNVPLIDDVRRAAELARTVGAQVEFHEAERTMVIDAANINKPVLHGRLTQSFRGSVLFVPALLHRLGEAVLEGVGGCNLGSRNLDFHYRGFARLGAAVA